MRYQIVLVPLEECFPSTGFTYNMLKRYYTVQATEEGIFPLLMVFLSYLNNAAEVLDEYGFILVDTVKEEVLEVELF